MEQYVALALHYISSLHLLSLSLTKFIVNCWMLTWHQSTGLISSYTILQSIWLKLNLQSIKLKFTSQTHCFLHIRLLGLFLQSIQPFVKRLEINVLGSLLLVHHIRFDHWIHWVSYAMALQANRLPQIEPTDPLFIHPCDNPGLPLVLNIFNGDNFENWKWSVIIALSAKHKLHLLMEHVPVQMHHLHYTPCGKETMQWYSLGFWIHWMKISGTMCSILTQLKNFGKT